MSRFDIIAQGMLHTLRLPLNHIHTRPVSGSRGRVLLLGGSNFDLRLKAGFLQSELCATFELVAYEPRGIGQTGRPDARALTMQDYAQDAIACLNALGWDRAHLLGESFGGMTALHVALMCPERLDHMALTSATAGGACGASVDISPFLALPRAEAAAAALELQDTIWVQTKESDPQSYQSALRKREAFEAEFADPSITSGGYAALLHARRGHDVSAQLPNITVPTLVCAGLRDQQAPPAAQECMARALPNGRYAEFDAGHGLLFGEDRATRAVLDFFAQTPVT